MATKSSFELYSLKEGQWQLDSVFHSKQDATHEAYRLIEAGHFDGVKIVQETYDEDTNTANVVTVMERKKGEEPKKPVRRKSRPEKKDRSVTRSRPKPKPQPKKGSLTHQVGMLVLSVCGILLVVVALGFYLVGLDK